MAPAVNIPTKWRTIGRGLVCSTYTTYLVEIIFVSSDKQLMGTDFEIVGLALGASFRHRNL